MEKIIDTAALIDQLKILLWDRSKTREELAELVIGLIEEAGKETIVRCRDCVYAGRNDACDDMVDCGNFFDVAVNKNGFCADGERRGSDETD